MEMLGYITYMEDYCDFYDELVALWEEKQRIIADNDLHLLEEQVKKEEVAVLRARGFEDKREKMQKQLGKDGMTLQQLIDETQGADQQRLRNAKHRLENSVKMLKNINESCQILVESRFEMLDRERERVLQKNKNNNPQEPKQIMNRSI